MNISAGISEIRPYGLKGKVYLWPGYPKTAISSISPVKPRYESNSIYKSVSPAERESLVNKARDLNTIQYNSEAKTLYSSANIKPGLLFDALV